MLGVRGLRSSGLAGPAASGVVWVGTLRGCCFRREVPALEQRLCVTGRGLRGQGAVRAASDRPHGGSTAPSPLGRGGALRGSRRTDTQTRPAGPGRHLPRLGSRTPALRPLRERPEPPPFSRLDSW